MDMTKAWTDIFNLSDEKSGLSLVEAVALYCEINNIEHTVFIKNCDPDMIATLKQCAIRNKHVVLKKPSK